MILTYNYADCERLLTKSNGDIPGENFHNIGAYLVCNWKISVNYDQKIALRINYINLDSFGFLGIFNGHNCNTDSIKSFGINSGKISNTTIISDTNHVCVRYISAKLINNLNDIFSISYNAIDSGIIRFKLQSYSINKCNSTQCSHFCVSIGSAKRCLCPKNMRLINERQCVLNIYGTTLKPNILHILRKKS